MKAKEESAEAGLHLNIKKTTIMTTEETHNFSTGHEDAEMGKDFVHFGFSHQFKWKLKPRIQGKTETQKGSNDSVRKDR